MPQLIAMVIVVVAAMIYMFQTFGGTGDKIEGVAQKTSVMTEINNIRGDLIVALKTKEVTSASTLNALAKLGYFSKQINDQLLKNTTAVGTYSATNDTKGQLNTYSAISFGGKNNPGMNISLVLGGGTGTIPGIRVQLLNGLSTNAAFLEQQVSEALASQASVDRTTVDGAAVTLDANDNVPAANRPSTVVVESGSAAGTATTNLDDGVFTVYFKDLETMQ